MVTIYENLDFSPLYLRECGGLRDCIIDIGICESTTVCRILEGTLGLAPLTHQLALSMISELGGKIRECLVLDKAVSANFAYYRAAIALQVGDNRVDVCARPSDAISFALLASVPLFVHEELLTTAPTN